MSKSLELLVSLIDEDKITIQEVLEACGYKVDVEYEDKYGYADNNGEILKHGTVIEYSETHLVNIGYNEKIIATKEFR